MVSIFGNYVPLENTFINSFSLNINLSSFKLCILSIKPKSKGRIICLILTEIKGGSYIVKGGKLADRVKVQFSKDYPLRVDYNLLNKLGLTFILAIRLL